MLKIPVEGVITLKSSKLVPLECAMVSKPEGASSATKPIIEERIKVAINPEYPEQIVMIGSTLTEEGRNKLCEWSQQTHPLNSIYIKIHQGTKSREIKKTGSSIECSRVVMSQRGWNGNSQID
ncbi:hypothetical protein Tco_0677547 [Tanacetum coccineum]|uniref:Uncharacterized protein n=1 Tax=Tanacetum coccineum TaxID=301880 RepID=A0ABQ4XCI4_9ASTR